MPENLPNVNAERRNREAADLQRSLTQVVRSMEELMHEFQSGWRARLDSDLATATKVWDERIEGSIQSGARRATDLVARNAEETARRIEETIGTRIGAMGKSVTDARDAAENQLAEVQLSFDHQIKRGQEAMAQISSMATSVDDQVVRLAALTQGTQEELGRRGSAMLEWHSQELARRTKQIVADWNGRMQTALEATGQETVTKLGVELERELSSRLDRAQEMLDRLKSDSHAAEDLLRAHLNRIEKFSEQAVGASLEKLDKAGTDWESRIGDAGRAATAKWFEVAEPEATNLTHHWRDSESVTPQDRSASLAPEDRGFKATVEKALVTPSPERERRRDRRLKISRPLLARPMDPKYREEVEATLNASRNGLYFATGAKHYYVGMHISVILGYRPNDPCNASSFGEIVRIEPLNNGGSGIAVRILMR